MVKKKPVRKPTKRKPVRKQTKKKPVRKQTKKKPVRKPTKRKPVRKPTKRKPVRKPTKKKRIFRAGAPTGDDSDLKEKEDCVLKCETECNKKFLSKTQVKLQRSNLGSGPKKGHKLFLSREQIDADEEAAIARRNIFKDSPRGVTIDDPTDPVLASKEAREVLTEDDEWVEGPLNMHYDTPVLEDFSDEKKLKKKEKDKKEDLVRRPSHYGRPPYPQPRENPDNDELADIFKQDRDEYNTRVHSERQEAFDQGSELLAKGQYEGAKEIFNKILHPWHEDESAKRGLHQAKKGMIIDEEAKEAQRRERGSGARQLVTGARDLFSSAVERISDVGRRD